MEEFLPEVFYAISPDAVILSSEMQDPYDIEKPMRIAVKYRIPGYAAAGKNRIAFTPLLARNLFSHPYVTPEFGMDTSITERKYGFRTRCSKLVEIRETVTLPQGMKPIFVPPVESVDGEWAKLSGGYAVQGNTLTFTLTHDMGKRTFEAEDWPAFRNALAQRMRLTELPVVFER